MARVTRLAPSPTGALHLGNARTFLVNWALARAGGWRVVLRIEDLDGPRIKPEAVSGIVETLRWLGMDWDEGPVVQSEDLRPYREAMAALEAEGWVYACDLTRQQIESAASAPQVGSGEVRFPAELRPAEFAARGVGRVGGMGAVKRGDAGEWGMGVEGSWRFATPPGEVTFEDVFAGAQLIDPSQTIGDFVVWTKRGTPAYQLAVVVDDARQGVTDVVRGDDLLDSAARQLLLYRALGLVNEPRYCHLPLVIGSDGKRLAKRHGDTRVDSYRALGVKAESVVGLIAKWCGVGGGDPEPMKAGELVGRLSLSSIPKGPVVFGQEDDRWLREQA